MSYSDYKDIYDSVRVTKSIWPAIQLGKFFDNTIGDELRAAAKEFPDRTALVEGIPDSSKRRRWTYAQLLADAEKVASALLDKFEPGERVAIWSDNRPEWVILEYGCTLAGIIIVTLNIAYKAQEFEFAMKQSGVAGLFLTDEYRGFNLLETAQKAKENLPEFREIFRFAEFEAFMHSGRKSVTFPDIKPYDHLITMYTSGTTGVPKGAMIHHVGLMNAGYYFTEMGQLEDGVYVSPLPLYHMGACGVAVMGCLTHRATLVITQPDPATILDCFEKEGGTFSLMPSILLDVVLAHPDRTKAQLQTLKNLCCMEMSPTMIERVKKELDHVSLHNPFGQTESSGVMTLSHPGGSYETVGPAFPGLSIKIVDPETGEIQPLNTSGEVLFRGYQNMIGYYNNPEANAKVFELDGWQHMGDICSMDEKGRLKVTGRMKEMIRRAGENIYPREIEGFLLKHPKVQNVIVLGVPSEQWGEEVAAVVTPYSFEDMPTPGELLEYCRANLAYFKAPRLYCFKAIGELPITLSGKFQKFIIRELFEKGEIQMERV